MSNDSKTYKKYESFLKGYAKKHNCKLRILKKFAKGFAIGAGIMIGFVALLLGTVFGVSFLVEYFNIPKPIVPLITTAVIVGSAVGGMFVVMDKDTRIC